MVNLKVGQRVKATRVVEGVIKGVSRHSIMIQTDRDTLHLSPEAFEVEVIGPTADSLPVGTILRHRNHPEFLYSKKTNGWFYHGSDSCYVSLDTMNLIMTDDKWELLEVPV